MDEINALESHQEFWNDAKKAGEITKEKRKCERILSTYTEMKAELDDAKELFEIAESEGDSSTLELLFENVESLQSHIQKVEIEVMLSGEFDSSNAIITIQPGAGGTESQDWASMLYRMYLSSKVRMPMVMPKAKMVCIGLLEFPHLMLMPSDIQALLVCR